MKTISAMAFLWAGISLSNGQVNWFDQGGISSDFFSSIFFTDQDTGWAAGGGTTAAGGGTIAKTVNGGLSWSQQTSGTAVYLNSVRFADTKTGWVVGGQGTILSTVNGGADWSKQTSGTTEKLMDLFFTDANTGWAVGGGGTILHTVNGGNTWFAQFSGTNQSLESVTFVDAKNGWAAGYGGTILRTVNGGAAWTLQSAGITVTFNSVFFTDKSNGWIGGDIDSILHTSDSGLTWTMQSIPKIQFYSRVISLFFTDAKTGWAVGNVMGIIHTSNGGESWLSDSCESKPSLHSIFLKNGKGWAVGEFGVLLTYNLVPSKLAAPFLKFPGDGAANLSIPTNLVWSRVPDAASYRLQVSNSRAFSYLLIDSSLADSVSSLNGLTLDTKYYWRVYSVNGKGVGDWSSTQSFTTAKISSLFRSTDKALSGNDIFSMGGELNFALSKMTNVTIQIFDYNGKRVGIILDEVRDAGSYHLKPEGPSSGAYLVEFKTDAMQKRILWVKP